MSGTGFWGTLGFLEHLCLPVGVKLFLESGHTEQIFQFHLGFFNVIFHFFLKTFE